MFLLLKGIKYNLYPIKYSECLNCPHCFKRFRNGYVQIYNTNDVSKKVKSFCAYFTGGKGRIKMNACVCVCLWDSLPFDRQPVVVKSLCGAVKRGATAVAVFHGSSGRHYCSESNVHPLALKAPWCAVHLVYLLSLGKPAANPRVLHARARTGTQNTRALTWREAYVCTRTRVRYTGTAT